MLMEALRPWINRDHEGVVSPGQRFEAHGIRATELQLAGLAVPVIDEDQPIKVVADPPVVEAKHHGHASKAAVHKKPMGARR